MKSALKYITIASKYIILISALLPALILLLLTLATLPNLISGFQFNMKEMLLLLSCLFGISGFIGLIILISGIGIKKYFLTIVLLLLGVIGSAIFVIVEGGLRAWVWITSIEEPGEWFIFVWPNIVSLAFIVILLFNNWNELRSLKN